MATSQPYAWREIRIIGVRLHHYNDVIMSAVASQITGVSFVSSAVCSDAHQRWKAVTGGFPSQRASSAENASIWWRHHDIVTGMHLYFVNKPHTFKSSSLLCRATSLWLCNQESFLTAKQGKFRCPWWIQIMSRAPTKIVCRSLKSSATHGFHKGQRIIKNQEILGI